MQEKVTKLFPDFWLARWQEGNISFHKSEIHPELIEFFPRLALHPGEVVLVPLCGKTKDLMFLRSMKAEVVGAELSPLAVESFFNENSISFEQRPDGEHVLYTGDGISIFCGNFFNLRADQLRQIRAVYDRASLIALPPAIRQQYAQKLTELLPKGATYLLLTMDFPEGTHEGPPFAVSEAEIFSLYEKHFDIQRLSEKTEPDSDDKKRWGHLSWFRTRAHLLVRR